MTEVTTAQPSSSQTIDFGQPFRFVFEDPDWIKKILIGGLFYVLSFLIVGIFFVSGYMVQLARNVINRVARPLPEWDNLGGYFVDGVKVFVIGFIYVLPLILVWAFTIGGIAMLEHVESGESLQTAFAGLFTCWMGIFILVALLYSAFMPAVLLMFITTGSIGEAFNFRRIWTFVANNIGNYVLAYLIHLVANFLSQFGMILLCIGVFFTGFWSLAVATYAFADAYRLARVK